MEHNILLFWFMNDWGLYGRTYEMVARHLSRCSRVRKVVCVLPATEIWRGYYRLPFHLRIESKKLLVVTPVHRIIPGSVASGKSTGRININLRDRCVAGFLKTIGFSKGNTVLWMFPPHREIDSLLKSVPHRLLITQIVDNHLYKSNEQQEMLQFARSQYESLARTSDLLFASSRSNLEWFSGMNPRCHLFENALDERFLRSPSELPCRAMSRRPRLGYVGWISQRTDLELLCYIARKRPQYDLHIAGPLENTVDLRKSGLDEQPNVVLRGPIPYEEVPGFLETLDVCLMPHRDTQYSQAMNPLKLFQYLGSGRPVVSTRVAGSKRWNGIVSVADTYPEFLEKIDETIQSDRLESSHARIEAVRSETWTARIGQMLQVLDEEICRKSKR